MKKLAIVAIISFLAAALSAQASEKGHSKKALRGVSKAQVIQPFYSKPATRLPIPVNTFRA
jgi:hypothetical protein